MFYVRLEVHTQPQGCELIIQNKKGGQGELKVVVDDIIFPSLNDN